MGERHYNGVENPGRSLILGGGHNLIYRAVAGLDQDNLGSIQPGKHAEIIILDRRVSPPNDLKNAKIWITMVNWEIKYRAP